jgi:hypothetical protein
MSNPLAPHFDERRRCQLIHRFPRVFDGRNGIRPDRAFTLWATFLRGECNAAKQRGMLTALPPTPIHPKWNAAPVLGGRCKRGAPLPSPVVTFQALRWALIFDSSTETNRYRS